MTPASVPRHAVPHPVATPDGAMPVLRWGPRDGSAPVLVVMQEIFGLSPSFRDRCARLADLGYTVLAPEVYWRLGGQVVTDDDPDFLGRAMALMQRVDWPTAVRDGLAVLEEARSLAAGSGVGMVGFCFGGGLAFDVTAQAPRTPDLLLSWYGSALPGLLDRAGDVTCPSQHHFGTADAYLPMDVVDTLTAALTADGTRTDVEVHLHEGAGHAFDNPHPLFHHPGASARSWGQAREFLGAHLPTG